MLTFHVIPLSLVIASEAWNLKVCACAMILDSSLRSATFRMTFPVIPAKAGIQIG